jgi:hypothetical protein
MGLAVIIAAAKPFARSTRTSARQELAADM